MTKEDKKLEVWHEKKDTKRQFEHMLDVMQTYCKLPKTVDKFVLDLQLYPKKEDKEQTSPRIWLTAPKNNMGVHLMLYGIELENKHGKVSNEDAIEVFSEYMKYYAQNQDKFKYENSLGTEWSIEITFEISNRSY